MKILIDLVLLAKYTEIKSNILCTYHEKGCKKQASKLPFINYHK